MKDKHPAALLIFHHLVELGPITVELCDALLSSDYLLLHTKLPGHFRSVLHLLGTPLPHEVHRRRRVWFPGRILSLESDVHGFTAVSPGFASVCVPPRLAQSLTPVTLDLPLPSSLQSLCLTCILPRVRLGTSRIP